MQLHSRTPKDVRFILKNVQKMILGPADLHEYKLGGGSVAGHSADELYRVKNLHKFLYMFAKHQRDALNRETNIVRFPFS